MSKLMKGIQALHDETPADKEPSGPTSPSDAVVAAMRAVDAAPEELQPRQDLEAFMEGGSKPDAVEAPVAPSLLPTGIEAIQLASAAVESDRVREYAVLAELDAERAEKLAERARLDAVIEATNATLKAAINERAGLEARSDEIAKQRVETVERIAALNQMMVDNEAARLRRG